MASLSELADPRLRDASPPRVASRAGWTLGLLTLVSTFNYLDRSLLGLLLPHIKQDLQLSDTLLGLISGLAFALFYCTLSLPIANLADRYSRRNIIAVGFAWWSLMTTFTGWVNNGLQLAVCRFLMGAGEAAGMAPSQSMISDSVKPVHRPLALSIFSTAAAVDALLLLPIAAIIADQFGWRAAFKVAGLVGLVLALLFVLTTSEPARQPREPSERETVSLMEAIVILWRISAFRWILAGVAFMGAALNASGAWFVTMLVRVHDMEVREIGVYVTPARGIIGIIGIIATGWLTDRLARRDGIWRFRVPALTAIIVVPAYTCFLLSDMAPVWITALVVVSAVQMAYQGPIFAATIALSPDNVKTVAVGLKVFVASMFGIVVGPLFVGMASDYLALNFGDHSIRYSMLCIPLCSLIGGLLFLQAGRAAHAN